MTTLRAAEEHIHTILEQDRAWSAYAIADLEPAHRPYCTWYANRSSVVLIYNGFKPGILFTHGPAESLGELFSQIPAGDYVFTLRLDSREVLGERLKVNFEEEMWRMVLDRNSFHPSPDVEVEELDLTNLSDLQKLFGDHVDQPDAFTPSQLEGGVYFGVREGDDLISVAGTHVLSRQYGLAALGNVFTRPDHRNRGLGTRVSSSVVDKLLAMGIDTIVLNVAKQNHPAVKSYTRIGFQPYCPYMEGSGSLKPYFEEKSER